jgi:hypothetical protein
MPTTYNKIATVTVGSGGASSIEFTSIPATYTDLLILTSTRCSGTDSDIRLTFNTSGGTYTLRKLLGNGSSVSSETGTNAFLRNNPSGSTASTFTNSMVYIPNYAGSNAKSLSADSVAENNATSNAVVQLSVGNWSGTSAITSIKIDSTSGPSQTLVEHSTATLYGIKKN